MIRVLLVAGEFPNLADAGGIGTYTAATAEALASVGCHVEVLVCARGLHSSTIERHCYRIHSRPLLRWALPLAPALPRTTIRLLAATSVRYWLRRLGSAFDVIEYPEWRADGAFLPPSNASRVVHLHTGIAVAADFDRVANPIDRYLAGVLERRGIRNADRVVAASQLIVDATREKVKALPGATVVPLGIDFRKVEASGPAAPGADLPIVLVVGRIVQRKGHLQAIEAMRILRTRGIRGALVFAGGPPRDRRGRRLLQDISRAAERAEVPLIVLGPVRPAELVRWYQKARVVLVPSAFESYSMVVIEAAAHSRPVVTTSRVGSSEHLTCITVTGPSPPELADGLAPYLSDVATARRAGELARAEVSRALDSRLLALRRIEAYRSTAADRARSSST